MRLARSMAVVDQFGLIAPGVEFILLGSGSVSENSVLRENGTIEKLRKQKKQTKIAEA
jgi:hypothetical protein